MGTIPSTDPYAATGLGVDKGNVVFEELHDEAVKIYGGSIQAAMAMTVPHPDEAPFASALHVHHEQEVEAPNGNDGILNDLATPRQLQAATVLPQSYLMGLGSPITVRRLLGTIVNLPRNFEVDFDYRNNDSTTQVQESRIMPEGYDGPTPDLVKR